MAAFLIKKTVYISQVYHTHVHTCIPRNCFETLRLKCQLLDPFLRISHVIYLCYAWSRGHFVAVNNKLSEMVEDSSLNKTFILERPTEHSSRGRGLLQAEQIVKGCKMPSSKLNTTAAVLNSQLQSSSRPCQPLKEEAHGMLPIPAEPWQMLGKGHFSCVQTAEPTRLQTKWGDISVRKGHIRKIWVDKVVTGRGRVVSMHYVHGWNCQRTNSINNKMKKMW